MSTSLSMRRVYAFSKGRVNPDSHGQWVQIDLFDGEFCCGLVGTEGSWTCLRGLNHYAEPIADSR